MKKIISLDQLIKRLKELENRKVVLATGCFDILHSAHKDFLKKAKAQGEILILGLEADKRVKELKGKGRPVNKWKIRAENLSAFPFVDFVFPLPEKFNKAKEHFKLLQSIKPDILAVSENTPHLKEKEKLIKKIGGQLKIVLPYNPQISTTKILKVSHPTLGVREEERRY